MIAVNKRRRRIILKIFSKNTLQRAYGSVQNAALDSKIAPKAGYDMYCILYKSTKAKKGKSEQIFWVRLSEQSLYLESVFNEKSRNFNIFFLFNKATKKLKTICTFTEST